MRILTCLLYLVVVSAFPCFAGEAVIKVFTSDGYPLPRTEILVAGGVSCPLPGAEADRTDSNGKFVTQFDGRVVAYVYKPGFVQGYAILNHGVNIIRLDRAGEVTGLVVDKDGNPVTGAQVAVNAVIKADGSRMSLG